MKMIGLSGPAGVGKDTIADILVVNYGFTKFSFSDALYREVSEAFGVEPSVLMNRTNKEHPMEALNYWYCKDTAFQRLMFELLREEGIYYATDCWPSPRWVLQRWGTDYRRKQDPEYWVKKAIEFTEAWLTHERRKRDSDPEHYVPPGGLVNCSVRFENERAFIESYNGEVWHVRRAGWGEGMASSSKEYVSERGLVVKPQDKVIHNNATVEKLSTATALLLGSGPGTAISCDEDDGPDLVTCTQCGWVHAAYTRQQAEEEVAMFNQWLDQHPEHKDLASPVTDREMSVKNYEGCDRCGGEVFRPYRDGEDTLGQEIAPVIYEQEVPRG